MQSIATDVSGVGTKAKPSPGHGILSVPTDGFWGNHIYVRGKDNDLGLL